MNDWKPLHVAPHDRQIKLYLPAGKYEHDTHGRPFNVENIECVGIWDDAQQHFVNRDTGHKVYASQWAEV